MVNGQIRVLITSDHHYGAVIDRDFDYTAYLNYLAEQGMNHTRIYPGGMFEPPDKYLPGNPLGPLPGRQILPWTQSTETGANPALAAAGQPSYKFDLEQWNPEYFSRLKAFVELARQKDIIVEVAFFNGMYADCWPLMAMYHGNNIQNVGNYETQECGLYTTADPRNRDVMNYQQAYITKITTELNEFDNLIYDICDEPSLVGKPDGSIDVMPDSLVSPWLLAMKDAFIAAEAPLPKKHLLGQTVQNLSPDHSAESWCQWLPAEYVRPALNALEKDYSANKPILDVESNYFGMSLVKQSYTVDNVRAEGWWFIVGGGAGFINLNGEYHRGQEQGGADTQTQIVPQKQILKKYIHSFELAGMSRFTGYSGLPENTVSSALAQPGAQYALYLCHGAMDPEWGAHLAVTPGAWQDTLTLQAVPSALYAVEWIDPASGTLVHDKTILWSGGDMTLTTPEYTIDIALRMFRE